MATVPFRRVHPWLTTLARVVLAGVLAYSGYQKAAHPAQSVLAVKGYQLLPPAVAEVVGYGLPFLELALAALLLAGFGTRIAAAVGGALFLVFVAGVAQAWARGLTIDCGCFGGGGTVAAGQTHYLGTILRDVGLVALAGWVVTFPPGRLATDTTLTRGPAPGTAARPASDEDEIMDEGARPAAGGQADPAAPGSLTETGRIR